MLTGNAGHVTVDPLRLRSIGAIEALKVAKHLHPELPVDLPDPLALRVRNAATHMALVDQAHLRPAVARMTRFIEACLPLLGLSSSYFWPKQQLPVIAALLDEAKSEVARTVRAKVAAAERRLADLTTSLPGSQVVAVLAALSGRPMSSTDHEEPRQCPVCKQLGWLLCGVDVDVDVDVGPTEYIYDRDDIVTGAYAIRTAYPFAFECPVCLLEVNSDEMAEFDFPDEIDLEPEDAGEEILEPDEDVYRGR